MKHLTTIALLCLLIGVGHADAQSKHAPATGLIWGNGTLTTSASQPTSGQAICNTSNLISGCISGGGFFATFVSTVTVNMNLPDSAFSLITTNRITEAASVTQTLPACTTDGKFYVVWETNNNVGGFSPTFAAPATWTLTWQLGGSPPTPNTIANKTDLYSFQCDLPHKVLIETGFVPAA